MARDLGGGNVEEMGLPRAPHIQAGSLKVRGRVPGCHVCFGSRENITLQAGTRLHLTMELVPRTRYPIVKSTVLTPSLLELKMKCSRLKLRIHPRSHAARCE